MTIDKKRRNFLLLCGALVGAYAFERSVEESARQAAYYRQRQQAIRAAQQRAKANARPVPPRPAPPTVHDAPARTPPSAPAPARAPATPVEISGIWQGKTAITGRGLCTLRVELHENAPGRFLGYSSLACANFAPLMAPQDRGNTAAAVLNRMNPAEAILSGAMENGSIRFHVDKTIGASSNGCAATSLTLTPFGSNQLAAEWQEGGCEGGHVILQKARK
jgi:hypothetical protein